MDFRFFATHDRWLPARIAAALSLVALLPIACDQSLAAPSPTRPRSLTVVLVRVDLQYQATAVAAFSDGSSREVTPEVESVSSNPNVAAVSETGRVTPTTAGTTEIRGTYQTVSGVAHLTVAEPPAPPAPSPNRRVTVRLRDALDQAPVHSVRLTLVPAGDSDGPSGRTNGAGEFSVAGAWGEYVTVLSGRL